MRKTTRTFDRLSRRERFGWLCAAIVARCVVDYSPHGSFLESTAIGVAGMAFVIFIAGCDIFLEEPARDGVLFESERDA